MTARDLTITSNHLYCCFVVLQTLNRDTAPVGKEELLLLVLLLLCGVLIAPSWYCRVYSGELGPKHWPNSRYEHVMKLKQAALTFARKRWADYILVTSSAPPPPHLIGFTSSNSCNQLLSPNSIISVRRHRQHPHQPQHPKPPDRREQVSRCSHAGLDRRLLQLLVRHHTTGEFLSGCW